MARHDVHACVQQETGACECGRRHTGRYCETPLDDHNVTTTTAPSSSDSSSGGGISNVSCDEEKQRHCQNGGTCVTTPGSGHYHCVCAVNYTGDNCDTPSHPPYEPEVIITSSNHVTLAINVISTIPTVQSPRHCLRRFAMDCTCHNSEASGVSNKDLCYIFELMIRTYITELCRSAYFAPGCSCCHYPCWYFCDVSCYHC